MPELPEVEIARRTAARVLLGRRIVSVSVDEDRLVFDDVAPTTAARRLRHRRVERLDRWGKYFWLELDRKPWPVLHLGMTGRIVAFDDPRDRPPAAKLVLTTDEGKRLAYTNQRRFGRIRFADDPLHEPPISRLGFDPLHGMPSVDEVATKLARRSGPIKGVLLDQSFAAGVGNWIADEVLYQTALSPHRPANQLTLREVDRLLTTLESVVHQAIDAEADATRFPHDWLFHHRWGRRREASTADRQQIRHETIAGRTAAWVPQRQH